MAIGQSKNQGMLDLYTTGSQYSTQAGNQANAGVVLTGTGFTTTGEYNEKYVGGNGQMGVGASVSHVNFEVFTRATEQPTPPVFYD